MRAFLEENIDNYVGTIRNKNLVRAEIHEGENPTTYPSGLAGCKTQYAERQEFQDKAEAAGVPAKEKFAKADRISTSHIEALSQTRAQSQLKLLAEQLDGELKAEALLRQ